MALSSKGDAYYSLNNLGATALTQASGASIAGPLGVRGFNSKPSFSKEQELLIQESTVGYAICWVYTKVSSLDSEEDQTSVSYDFLIAAGH